MQSLYIAERLGYNRGMPELLPLDAAAAVVGKSEITLRRLIKTGKVPAEREQTITGFIYRVDPELVKAYYSQREAEMEAAAPVAVEAPGTTNRLAVSTQKQDNEDYWRKRAERYEQKYDESVKAHLHTKEEVGMWRAKAEHASQAPVPMAKAAKEKPVVQPQPAAPLKKTAVEVPLDQPESALAKATPIVLGLLVALAIAGGIVATQLH